MAVMTPITEARVVAPVFQLPLPSCGTPASPFIAALLAPIELPKDARATRRYANDLRREWENAWSLAYHRYQAAQHLRSYWSHARNVAVIEQRRSNVPELAAEQRAFRKLVDAIHALMLVPAPSIGALWLKEKMMGTDGGRAEWKAAIAADLARLGGRPGQRRMKVRR